jgi:Cdc6-like AAA superfamily ATPase
MEAQISTQVGRMQRLALVSEAFTPSAPVADLSFLSGRLGQIGDLVSAVSQRGQHVALYGERGVGKTSLANIMGQLFQETHRFRDLLPVSVNCHTNDDFSSLWANLFRELNVEDPPERISPEDVRYVLRDQDQPTLLVIDELDRLEDDEALSLLADTIKTLSDHSVSTTLVLVGIADSVEQLIGDHRSIERALVQVGMPRMSMTELTDIINKGCDHAGLDIADEQKQRIATLSAGLPHYTHLLCLHAAQLTVREDREEITEADVETAIRAAVEKHTIRSEYDLAVRSAKKDNLFPEVLLACALARKRDLGHFAAGAVRHPLSKIRDKDVEIASYVRHLNKFTQDQRGAVLQQYGEKRGFFYRFRNPILQPYVILSGLSQGIITYDLLVELQKDGAEDSQEDVLEEPTTDQTNEQPPLF